MRVEYRDRRYRLDRKGFQTFLAAQGFSPEAIAALSIHIRATGPADPDGKRRILGEFKKPSTIYLYTYGSGVTEVNNTLLHEARHYGQALAQWRLYLEREAEYKKMRASAQKTAFYYKHILMGWELPSEEAIPYWYRPREQDACAWARMQEGRHQFITALPVVHVRLQWAFYERYREALSDWTRRNSGALAFSRNQPVLAWMARADMGRFWEFCVQQGATVDWKEYVPKPDTSGQSATPWLLLSTS